MGKSYYCEYCDKRFRDNATSRRNHLKGVTHRELKKAHFDSFKDAETILRENEGKNQCRQFLNTGACQFNLCQYSHITPDHKVQLERRAAEKRFTEEKKRKEREANYSPDLESWLLSHSKSDTTETNDTNTVKHPVDNKKKETASALVLEHPVYELPECLRGRVNLPPSLLPPKAGERRDINVDCWG